MCSCANVLCVITCWHASVGCVLTWSRANLPCVLTCSHCNVPYLLTCSRANVCCVLTCSRANVPCMPTGSHAITSNCKNNFQLHVLLRFLVLFLCLLPVEYNCIWNFARQARMSLETFVRITNYIPVLISYQAEAFNGYYDYYDKLCTTKWFDFCLSKILGWLINSGRWIITGGKQLIHICIYVYIYIYI